MNSYFGMVVEECKDLLKILLYVNLFFVKQSANAIAHYIAKASHFIADRIIQGSNVSLDIQNVLRSDLHK